jgi:hypothetical protein
MDQERNHPSETSNLTRRELMRDGAAAAAGMTAGLGALGSQSARADTKEKTRSYNPEMEYRRLGKTNLWVSAVCLGGHWKRIDKMVPGVFKDGKKWLSADLDMINTHQVDSMARAVKERRELDVSEAEELAKAMDEAWANLPADYQWLKDREYA